MSEPPAPAANRPHPALVATVAAAATLAATLGVEQLAAPHQVKPGGTKPLSITSAGTWQGVGAGPHVTLAGRKTADVCAYVKANGVVLQDLSLVNGFRGFQANDRQKTRCVRVTVKGSGVPGARQGGCWFTVNCQDLTLDHCQGLDSKGAHALYLSNWNRGRTANVTVLNSLFTGSPVVALCQVNTASGGPSGAIAFRDCSFQRGDGKQDLWNLLGAGTEAQPVEFTRCEFPPPSRRVLVLSNYDAGRPTYAAFADCGDISGSVTVEGGSRLYLRGNTRLSGKVTTTSGGKVVRQ